ncbi:hypothetical protein G6F50_017442 [Rhizopus delemar]|uniref:Uncharacterized protein n=1 Tax=Rhizopus delemar TaxID=936053 RepID=A0A9P7C063_9FUNG|nr:hypothetical protein G6F50_017442 [Rhizopus delemar]
MGHGTHVVRRAEGGVFQPGMHASGTVQGNGAARAGADLDPSAQIGVVVGRSARGVHQVHRIAVHRRRHLHRCGLGAAGEQRLLRNAGGVGMRARVLRA